MQDRMHQYFDDVCNRGALACIDVSLHVGICPNRMRTLSMHMNKAFSAAHYAGCRYATVLIQLTRCDNLIIRECTWMPAVMPGMQLHIAFSWTACH